MTVVAKTATQYGAAGSPDASPLGRYRSRFLIECFRLTQAVSSVKLKICS